MDSNNGNKVEVYTCFGAAWQQWRVVVAIRRLVRYLRRNRRKVQLSLKLLVSFFQIATKVPTVYQVRMPQVVLEIITLFGFASLDLESGAARGESRGESPLNPPSLRPPLLGLAERGGRGATRARTDAGASL